MPAEGPVVVGAICVTKANAARTITAGHFAVCVKIDQDQSAAQANWKADFEVFDSKAQAVAKSLKVRDRDGEADLIRALAKESKLLTRLRDAIELLEENQSGVKAEANQSQTKPRQTEAKPK